MAMNDDQHFLQRIEKLREVFLLLEPGDLKLMSAEDKQKREDALEVLELYSKNSARIIDYYHVSNSRWDQKCNFNSMVPRFLQLLRECVLTHQWQQALKVVQAMSKEMRGTENPVWRVGSACLYQEGEKNSRLVEQFVKHVVSMGNLSVIEVMLDYLLFLLSHNNLEDAKELVQQLKLCQKPVELRSERKKMANTLFFAYQGLVLYVEWKSAVLKKEREDSEEDSLMVSMAYSGKVSKARSIADSAVDRLSLLQDKPGVWDVFISRLVEIHVYYGDVDKARHILQAYRERNLTNPNAHRYLYELERDQDGDEDVQLQCLKDIVRLDPCNSLTLTLFRLTESAELDAVHLLFDYLDYCQDEDAVWAELITKLGSCDTDPNVRRAVRACWETRKDWWPAWVDSGEQKPSYKKYKNQAINILRNLEND